MTNQTARRPEVKRPTRSARPKKYARQTAHVEARRDGKPLIFGWGAHLSRNEKNQLQRRAIWSTIILFSTLIVVVVAGFWINNNIIVPNQPITSIAGQSIPQSDYHKLVALKAALERNKIEGKHGLQAQISDLTKKSTDQQKIIDDQQKKIDDLNKQISALPAGTSDQRTSLEGQLKDAQSKQADAKKQHDDLAAQGQKLTQTTIPNEQVMYTTSQISSDSGTWLQEDVLLRNWLNKQSASVQNKINATDAQVQKALDQLKANFPTGKSYDSFLSDSNVSDGDMHTMMALKLRRDNAQLYFASQITSPAKQVQASAVTLSTQKDAQDFLNQVKGGKSFADLAKEKSLDNDTKTKGGDLGWLVQREYIKKYGNGLSGGPIDLWLFDSARQVNDLSPIISDNGTFHVLQITAIDPSRAIDSDTLKLVQGDTSTSALRDNSNDTALTSWLVEQKALPGNKPGQLDPDKMNDPLNMPSWIPTSPPTTGATGGQSLPNGGASAGGIDPTGAGGAGGTTGGTNGG
ncbi:peptidylprolyl isomerase [Tengunoibacter tsumagoiensis]|uniref:PpiC domain-containing protein n=1 Tax=Tengunoibacter tsumagoiensis TaxID=2014871 RepID=A0A401ZU98_9CHLR|nr:peptidylprolyl isomerase [Tengunoibacter tsumagoiensis]GCE10340.1 hypothetical protein KTT_01990 [Tengunoibacter tsumagoiensis]